MNLYDFIPLHRLQELIGERRLESVRGVLRLISSGDFDPGIIDTRVFSAKIGNIFLGSTPLTKKELREELISYVPTNKLREVCARIGLDTSGLSHDQLSEYAISSLTRASTKLVALKAFGFDVDNLYRPEPRQFCVTVDPLSFPFKQLKKYQFEVFFKAEKLLSDSDVNRFIVQMPTGAGKTRTAMEVICSFLLRHPGAAVVWLAHSKELCEQAIRCFADIWPHLGSHPVQVYRLFGDHGRGDISDAHSAFICASFQSLYALSSAASEHEFQAFRLPDRRLIVVDEAHKVIATTYKKVTRSLLGPRTSVMGLTATPGRSMSSSLNTQAENDELAQFFFNQIISFDTDGRDPITYLRSIGVLASAKMVRLAISGSQKLSPSELQYVNEMFDLPASVLNSLSKSVVRNAEIISQVAQLVKSGSCKSVIYFGTSVEQSILTSLILRLLDIPAAHIDSSTQKTERTAVLEAFKAGHIPVLCNYEILATGFDAPKVDCVFIARPTLSVVLYSQMIGRGLRGPEIGGTRNCLVVNVLDNIENLPQAEDMYTLFDEYWI